ncbi:MAG TPA: sigma-54 dependent transcriptional regulator [Chitinophagales bacterium]|nr:sigma-54 dependent transcriptional regulator [Chitinophagales bacterium]
MSKKDIAPCILLVDDERPNRRVLREIFEFEKFKVEEAEDGEVALDLIIKNDYDVILLDIKMPKKDGMEVLDGMREAGKDTPVVVLSGHGTIETAVEAVKKGAYDYVPKPPDLNRILITVRNAMEKSSLVTETKTLRKKISSSKTKEMIGESSSMMRVKEMIDKVAPTEARVLITGANGSGKELVARWLHEKSNRVNGPLIEVNCAAIPSELIESELFGHEKGAFTSAIKTRKGKFELAEGGTLFLDEIGDMSLSAQAKVLRALQENKITKVGGEKELKVNVRVIAATNKDLHKEIEEGRFRMDLYHRLSVIEINVPSLNERKEDIPLLTMHFLNEICNEYVMPVKKIDQDALELLKSRNWTGNIRELRNIVERLIIMSGKTITVEHVKEYVNAFGGNSAGVDFGKFDSLAQFSDYMQRIFIEHFLEKERWQTAKAAERLQVSKKELENMMSDFGLTKR